MPVYKNGKRAGSLFFNGKAIATTWEGGTKVFQKSSVPSNPLELLPTNVASTNMQGMFVGSDGILYFLSGEDIRSGSGLWYLANDGNVYQTNLTSGSVMCAATSPNGIDFFGTNNNGLWYRSPSGGQLVKVTPGAFNFCSFLASPGNGLLYAGSRDGSYGIGVIDDSNPSAITFTLSQSISITNFSGGPLGLSSGGTLCLGGGYSTGLYRWDESTQLFVRDKTGGSSAIVNGLSCLGRLYGRIANNSGYYYFDDTAQTFVSVPNAFAFPIVVIRKIGGVWWAGTTGAGLKTMNADDTVSSTGISSYNINAIARHPITGVVYFGGSNGVYAKLPSSDEIVPTNIQGASRDIYYPMGIMAFGNRIYFTFCKQNGTGGIFYV
jgi:ribosomal protein L24E